MTETTKTCTKCRHPKPLIEFSKKTKYKDGLSYWCKDCEAIEFKHYRDRTPEHNQRSLAINKRLNDETRKTATQLNLPWTKEEDDFVREFHATETAVTIAQALGRTFSAVNNRSRFLGLKKRADSRLSELLASE